jgi:LysM repeat protein
VPALLYTVQRGDTLSLIAERLYGDHAQYTRIFQASRDIRQDDGAMLENPNLIRPGWRLCVPLPVLHLSVSGDHALYVVQPGDAESVIAARFLGDWRRYVEIDHLSRGVLQPDGGMLENPNLIQPGWILRLPLDGRLKPAPLPLRLKRHIVPRRTVRRHRHVVAPTAQTVVARATRHPQTPAMHPPRPEPPAVHATHQPPLHQEWHHQEHMLRPVRAMRHLQPLPPARSAQRMGPGRVRPKQHVHPRRLHARDVRRGVGIQPPVVAAHPLVPGTCPPPGQSPVAVPPVVRLPDSDRLLPLALVLGLLSLCTLRARYRAAGRLARAVRAGQWVVLSMQRALLAAQAGAQGLLERRLRRVAVTTRGHGNVVAHVLAALAAAGTQAGVPVNLARLTRRVTESQQAVSVLVEVRHLTDDLLAQVTAALQTTLGTPVQAERSVASGRMPCVRLTLKRSGLAVSADGWGPGQGRPHPAPLLMPVGHADGTVVHLNLGRSGAALVAGGTQGATTLVATLLAGSVIQAHPRELRLLVASADDELRGILPVLEHLEAPPADAGDVAAMTALVDQAYGVVLERFTAGENEPAGPAYLLVLDRVETLRANRRALDRLDVICRNGHLCDVHVLATMAAPVLLEEEVMMACATGAPSLAAASASSVG